MFGRPENLNKLYSNDGTRNELSGHTRLESTVFGLLNTFVDVQLRHTTFSYNGDVNMNRLSWTFVNPKVGVSYHSPVGLFYVGVGKTHREPTRTDMFQGNDNLDASTVVNATPESVVNTEIGVRHRFGIHTYSVNAYFMSFNNELTLAGNFGPNGLPLTTSVDESYRRGIEFEYTLSDTPGWISLSAVRSWNKITQDGVSFSPVLTPTVLGTVETGIRWKSLSLQQITTAQNSTWMNLENTEKLNSFVDTDVILTHAINSLSHIGVKIANAFNSQHMTNGYVDWSGTNRYHVVAPRNITAFLRASF